MLWLIREVASEVFEVFSSSGFRLASEEIVDEERFCAALASMDEALVGKDDMIFK